MDLNLLKYWWLITHSLPRHGRFCYLTETLIKSQCSAQQSQLKVKCQNQEYFNLHDLTGKQKTKIQIKWAPDMIKSHQGQFWKHQNMRNSLNNNIFLLKLKIWSKCSEKCKFFLSFWPKYCWYPYFWHLNQGEFLGYYSDFWSKFLLGTKSKWVIDHQYLRTFRGCYKS